MAILIGALAGAALGGLGGLYLGGLTGGLVGGLAGGAVGGLAGAALNYGNVYYPYYTSNWNRYYYQPSYPMSSVPMMGMSPSFYPSAMPWFQPAPIFRYY